ncbi:hypothetical protein [Curvivirga sp.]|uniref:hypothetical protein n=1 Tax=Curvivirga sp. TaxID=2856848 RepID=UPI003B59653B
MKNNLKKISTTFAFLLILFGISQVVHAAEAISVIKPFFGTYEGDAISSAEEADKRSLRVKVWPTGDDSFHLIWETTVHKTDGREKVTEHSVEFRVSKRDGVYGSAMRKNLFGKWEPLNPMKGDPYIWAKIKDDTFIVYAMIITEDGGYEMQQYNRRIIDDETMELVFNRIRDGEKLRTIKGFLKRVESNYP